jgi:hypothetical protein
LIAQGETVGTSIAGAGATGATLQAEAKIVGSATSVSQGNGVVAASGVFTGSSSSTSSAVANIRYVIINQVRLPKSKVTRVNALKTRTSIVRISKK